MYWEYWFSQWRGNERQAYALYSEHYLGSCTKVQPFHHPATQNTEIRKIIATSQIWYNLHNSGWLLRCSEINNETHHTGHLCWMGFQRFPVKCLVYSGQLLHGWVFSQGCVTLCMTPALIRGSETGTKHSHQNYRPISLERVRVIWWCNVHSYSWTHPDFPQQLSNNVEGRYPCRCGKRSSSQTFNWTWQEQF